MAKPVKVVVTFDDGTSIEHSLDGITSIFVNESAARRCNRNPPYKYSGARSANDSTTDPTSGTGDTTLAAAAAGQCYYVNGMIFCP